MFSQREIQKMRYEQLVVSETYFTLMRTCVSLADTYADSREYLLHGFLRRLGTLQRCIQNVYAIYSPERFDIPPHDECLDLAINLQGFVFNVFGCIDNLAWVWVIEKQLITESEDSLRLIDVSFQKRRLKKTLPIRFREYLHGLNQWFEYLESFRHALAHRVPLYVVPYTVSPTDRDRHNELETRKSEAIQRRDYDEYNRLDAEQMTLGRFTPVMTHSQTGSSGIVYFHSQVLADWNTVAEIAHKFFEVLSEATPRAP